MARKQLTRKNYIVIILATVLWVVVCYSAYKYFAWELKQRGYYSARHGLMGMIIDYTLIAFCFWVAVVTSYLPKLTALKKITSVSIIIVAVYFGITKSFTIYSEGVNILDHGYISPKHEAH